MKFPSAIETDRPKRLNAKIRAWAWESMHGRYGDEAMKTPAVEIKYEGFENLYKEEKYDLAIMEIAKSAPLRLCEEELISGSATLGDAIFHLVPARYNGKPLCKSVSHLTIDYETTLKKGLNYYREQVENRLKDEKLSPVQKRCLKSMLSSLDAIKVYHERYLLATKESKSEIYEILQRVPFLPARTFHEAVQSLWFIFSFTRLCGNWSGIGRIDWLLGDYLKKDLKEKRITLSRAREILASFFIKGTEWIQSETPLGTGDAQHYQNIVLAGLNDEGKEVTNEVTYLVLDIIEELGISDFPITVRINENTPEKLLTKVAKVMRHGGGVVAVYNEPLILKSLENAGYEKKEALNFANDGCWEVQVPGKTRFVYLPFDSLAILQKVTLNGYESKNFTTFEELYSAYLRDLKEQVLRIYEQEIRSSTRSREEENDEPPCSVISLFEKGCIENARSYHEGGPIYNVRSPHIGGVADTVNSLYAIKKLVFDDKKATLSQLLQASKNDWEEDSRLLASANSYSYYGTDNDEVDEIYKRLLHDYYLMCAELNKSPNFWFFPGVSTFGREIEWSVNRLATPFGRKKGTILSGNASPTPGTETEGVTAVIKSYCKADLSEMVTGTALDLKIMPTLLVGESGVMILKSLIKAFVSLNGYFMQIDSVSAETLRKAQENPLEYKTLSVRVSGWNARFVTLTKEWQDMIINRFEHNG